MHNMNKDQINQIIIINNKSASYKSKMLWLQKAAEHSGLGTNIHYKTQLWGKTYKKYSWQTRINIIEGT